MFEEGVLFQTVLKNTPRLLNLFPSLGINQYALLYGSIVGPLSLVTRRLHKLLHSRFSWQLQKTLAFLALGLGVNHTQWSIHELNHVSVQQW